ncbi:MAG: universal stress protein [Steroidobacteraceae bacterium]
MNVRRNLETNPSRRLLCASDLTPRSERALRRAVLLARQMEAKLTVLHVIDAARPRRAVRAESNRAYVNLLSLVEKTSGPGAANIDISVLPGRPFDVISKAAIEWDADLLVIAAPEPRPLDSLVGTTAERLIRATERPVLLVRDDAQRPYERVALATDLSSRSIAMMRTAAEFGILDGTQATVLHAFEPPYQGQLRAAGVDDVELQGYRGCWRHDISRRVHAMLSAAGVDPHALRVRTPVDLPLPAIRNVVEQERAELLAIGSSRWFAMKRLLIGSVADGVLRGVDCDVLVIPHTADVTRDARELMQPSLHQNRERNFA